jgi:hypothetical protein
MTLYESAPNRRVISGQLVCFVTWLAVTAIGAFLHPSHTGHGTHEQLGLPPCPSVLLFDRPCPGCGLTTSWTALIHGDLAFSLHAHPLGPILYLIFTAIAVLGLIGWFKQMRLLTDSPRINRVLLAGAVVFLGFGLARMAVVSNYRTLQDVAALR